MERKQLSVCLVVKNEEKYLLRCLESIAGIADEIVVVDTGSTDRTIEIARQYSDKVYSIKWRDNFGMARNYALGKATCEWILFLDGDEELTPESIGRILANLLNNDYEGFLVKVLNYYESGKQVKIAPDVVFRIFRNKKEYRYSGAVYEQICDNILAVNPCAKIAVTEDICIIHYGYFPDEAVAKSTIERNTKLLLKAVKRNPHSLPDRFHLGIEFFRDKQLDKALAEFLFVADRADPQAFYVPKLFRYITKCHYLLGNAEDALWFIDDVWSKLYPDHGDLFFLKGQISLETGRYLDAYESFQHCLEAPPQPAYYANLYCHHKDQVFIRLGEISEYYCDKEKALEYYIRALQDNPRAAAALTGIIKILNPRENSDYTMEALNTVFDLSDPGIQLDLANLFFAERAYNLAIDCVSYAAGKVSLPPEAHLIKGLSLIRSRQSEDAIQELSLIPANCSAYGSAQENLFLYFWVKGEEEKSGLHLKNLKNSGQNPRLTEALDILQEGLYATPDDLTNSSGINQEMIEILGILIEMKNRAGFEQAWNCFEGLFVPQSTQVLVDLFYKYNIYDLALIQYLRLLGQNQATPETLYRLGEIYQNLGSPADAEHYLQKAIEKGYNNPRVHWGLARLYQQMAIKTLEEGLYNYPAGGEIAELLKNLKDNLIEV
ncbi:MAG: glycosyltransferase [Thermincola sp.]|nr:glycosyltransferase [Thermincola sp.]MDT3704052.1 glycosyltransferase [Thermincola sp.]